MAVLLATSGGSSADSASGSIRSRNRQQLQRILSLRGAVAG
ncbi:hypothetical protein [Pseudarthrobacter sp. MDT1-22]